MHVESAFRILFRAKRRGGDDQISGDGDLGAGLFYLRFRVMGSIAK